MSKRRTKPCRDLPAQICHAVLQLFEFPRGQQAEFSTAQKSQLMIGNRIDIKGGEPRSVPLRKIGGESHACHGGRAVVDMHQKLSKGHEVPPIQRGTPYLMRRSRSIKAMAPTIGSHENLF
jgi:hypothetical protein